MRFSLLWSDTAYQELAAIYMQVGNADQILDDAIERIERILQVDPFRRARPCEGDWYFREGPLTVFFAIDSIARQVTILSVAFTA